MASGLNSLLTGTTTQATTMPSWYSTAQQNLVNNATSAANSIPAFSNTVGQQAVNNLSNPNTNPFTQAQNNLNTIAQGATNPWLTSANGTVKPNTDTAMGGLFAAQDQQLRHLIPQTVAPADAGAIANGQFGSLRGDTAADTAITNAQANLTAQQMNAALQNQQTGVNASTGLGNVGAQGTSAETTLGQIQQNAPMTAVADFANVLNTIKSPTSTTQSYTIPLAAQVGGLQALYGTGSSLLNGLATAGKNILSQVSASNPFGSNTYSNTPTANNGTVDTSGSSPNTWPSILGGNTSGNTDTGVYTPTNTSSGGIDSSAGMGTPGQSAYYTGGGFARGGLVIPSGLI